MTSKITKTKPPSHFSFDSSNNFKKDLKKIADSPNRKKELKKILLTIKNNFLVGEKIKSSPNLYKTSFNLSGVSYRIIYQVFKKEKLILGLMIAKRGMVYKKLQRKV